MGIELPEQVEDKVFVGGSAYRSSDKLNFEVIGQVSGNRLTSEEKNYFF